MRRMNRDVAPPLIVAVTAMAATGSPPEAPPASFEILWQRDVGG